MNRKDHKLLLGELHVAVCTVSNLYRQVYMVNSLCPWYCTLCPIMYFILLHILCYKSETCNDCNPQRQHLLPLLFISPHVEFDLQRKWDSPVLHRGGNDLLHKMLLSARTSSKSKKVLRRWVLRWERWSVFLSRVSVSSSAALLSVRKLTTHICHFITFTFNESRRSLETRH